MMRKNGTVILYDLRPTVVFNRDGTGYVDNDSVALERFNWTLKTANLNIIHKTKNVNYMFDDAIYIAAIVSGSPNFELLLTHAQKIQTFILHK